MEIKECAVVFLDVVDYSRLMSLDQIGTHKRFNLVKEKLLLPIVGKHAGRVMRLLGDGILLEFKDGEAAIRFCTDFQTAMEGEETDSRSDQLMRFRIGANFGEVLYDSGEVYGTEVNIAARLEHIASPGGILITDRLYDLLPSDLGDQFHFGGNQALKNIDREVAVWGWNKSIDKSGVLVSRGDSRRRRPTVAVLPFDNFGGNTDDEYFVDGLTEDLITRLAYSRVIQVIDRNSTFQYRARPRDIQKIGQILGAKYVLEGSIRKSASRIRINAHLVDSTTGVHVWAHTYNDEMTDVFETQDKISEEIVRAIFPAITSEEIWSSLRKSPSNLDAWDHVLHGLSELNKFRPDYNRIARRHLSRALESDDSFAFAQALMSRSHFADGYFNWSEDEGHSFDKAMDFARLAIESDPREAEGYIQHTWTCLITHNHRQAEESSRKALELNPAASYSNFTHGLTQLYVGELSEAIDHIELAIKLSPADPLAWIHQTSLGMAYFCAGDFERCNEIGRRCGETKHGLVSSNFLLSISYAKLGQIDRAKKHAEPINEMGLERRKIMVRNMPFEIEEREALMLEGLMLAGWELS